MVGGHSHSGSTASNAPPCPDPSVHEKDHKMSEAASAAALIATNPDKQKSPLDSDGKLSSASAATSLKYAKPQDLPSFPSLGGTTADAAGKAAMLAKDYKMKELWQPELSSAGSKAALLAHEKGSNLDLWQPGASADGNSAATLAMRNKNLSPEVFHGNTGDNKSNALLAATASLEKTRQRAESKPVESHPAYPDSHNSSANALSAATASHRTSTMKGDGWSSEAMQAARVHNLHMDPAMFTEHPPVQPEVDEASHNAALHASAVTMAKQLYDAQNRVSSQSQSGAEAATARNASSTSPDIKQQALQYISLQDTAHKLAAERLAKIDKSLENDRYRQHYGYGDEDKSKRLSHRLSVRNALGRGRASSEADNYDDSDDELQANRIRSQMSQLNSGISQVDANKQKDDRAKLLAAAEKRVSAQMHALDEQVFLQTGKVPPAMMAEWEEKSRKRAAEAREEQARNPGKTHIGGGKYMDQAEIEAIALARLKPTLDDLNETAEKRRARDEELRLEKERQDDVKLAEKEKTRLQKEEFKRLQHEDKAAHKREKEDVKAREKEEKRLAKEEKRKSHHEAKDAAAAGAAGATLGEVAAKVKDDDEVEDETEEPSKKHRSFLGGFSGFRSLRGRDDKKEEKIKEKEEKQKRHSESKDAAAAVAAGAVLGEVAEKVKHDQEEPTSSPAAIEAEEERKHRSLLAKLKGGDKEGRPSKDDDDKLSKAEKKELAAAAAAGATLGEVAEKVKHSQDEPVSPISPIETEEEREHKSLLAKLKEKKEDHDAAKAEKAEIKEHEKAEKQAEKEAHKAEKIQAKEAHKHEKEAEKEAAAAVAAGATLGEVAEKVKHNRDEPEVEDEGVAKHRSAVAALKEKLSKDKDATQPEAEESAVEPKSRSHAGAATAAAVAGGAAGGAVIADAATSKDEAPATTTFGENGFLPVAPVEQGPAPTAAATSEESEFLPVAQVDPTQPATHSEPATTAAAATSIPTIAEPEAEKSEAIPFEQQGGLSRYSNDAVPTLSSTRPDLERHISQIPENDDDDDDDEDDDVIAAVAKTTEPQPETVEEPKTRAGKIGATIAKGVAPMAASFGPAVPYHESAAVKEDDEKAAAQTKALDDKVRNVLADNTAPLASAFAPVAAVKPSHATEDVSDPLDEQRFKPEQQQTGPTVVGSGGSIAKDESSRPGTADTITPANAGESDKKGLKGFFSKLKPKSGKETSEKEKLPEFKTVARQNKETAAGAAPAKTSSDGKIAALGAASASTVGATDLTNKDATAPGTLTNWQTVQSGALDRTAEASATHSSHGSLNPPTVVNANIAAPATSSSTAKTSAPATTTSAAPAPTVAAVGATTEAGIVPGTISTWQKPSPLPTQPGQTVEIAATDPSYGTANPTTATIANTAAPATTIGATHDDHTDDEDHPSRTSRIAAALGLKPKQERNKLHKRSLDEQPARGDETEDDDDNFYDADQGVTPTTGQPPASVLTGSGASVDHRKETKFTENL